VLNVDRLYIIAQVSLGPFMTARFLEFQTAAYVLLFWDWKVYQRVWTVMYT